MKNPSESESKAAHFLSRVTEFNFAFNDFRGAADFIVQKSDSQIGLLEVTTYTNKSLHQYDKLFASENLIYETDKLKFNWYVSIPDPPNMKILENSLIDALLLLESHGIEDFWSTRDIWSLKHISEYSEMIKALSKIKIETAKAIDSPILRDQNPGIRVAACVRSGEYVYGGPDSSLEIIESFVASEVNDLKKLSAFEGENHYWVWIDQFTDREVREAFETDGLPSRQPKLPKQVKVLWVADSVTGRIWTNFLSEDGHLKLMNLAF